MCSLYNKNSPVGLLCKNIKIMDAHQITKRFAFFEQDVSLFYNPRSDYVFMLNLSSDNCIKSRILHFIVIISFHHDSLPGVYQSMICCFFSIHTYMKYVKMLSSAVPAANIKAIFVSVGTYTPVTYRMNAPP